jgi:hypothetical protein
MPNMTDNPRPTPVRCICGSLSSGDIYPFRGKPMAQHAEHVATVHGSRSASQWIWPQPVAEREEVPA